MSNKRLIKSTGLISFATCCSRVFGFARDILIANFFGTTIFAQAFVVAFRIPNLLRDLIGEGAANAAFVPVLTEYYTTRSKEDFWRLAKNLLYILVITLFVISLCGILLAPAIVRLIAPGFIEDTAKLAITIELTRIIFPFIFLIGLVAYGMGVLNSLDHFASPAFGPVLLNISMILFLIYVCPKIGIKGLALAVLVGGALQVALIGTVLYRKGLRFLPPTFFFHPAIKRIWRLLVPRFFGSAVYQLSVIVDNIFSTFGWIVGVGAPAALWYSYRLFHLPLAIFGIALATVALPKMSKEVARKDISALKDTISFSMRSVLLVLIPAGIGLATLGRPIIRILFERGEFTPYSTLITDNALFFYSFGLFACGGIKILVNAFFSLGDTRTPVKVASVSFFVNLVLNFVLMWPLKIGGLALATSIAATSNFIMLYILLTRKIGDIGTRRILNSFGRIIMASAIMGIFSYAAAGMLLRLDKGILINFAGLLAVVFLSAAIYILSSLALGIGEVKAFVRWILKKD
ncbi:MAG: murein biosynthesis integral membrane protein MurJ [Candidatus Omnitrophota bacterium]|nr:MAG: murein biosynthesis integral membrane protein MurJ [Candidatus Omnitrophota bacterium]